MPYESFHNRFPDVAELETRLITILERTPTLNLPPGQYTFIEMFCNEQECDCRRVFFAVSCSFQKAIQAVIAWGWEPREFYAKWLGDNDSQSLADLMGPVLNLASPQSALAPALLDIVRNVLLKDITYVERVKRHYDMFRKGINRINPTRKKK